MMRSESSNPFLHSDGSLRSAPVRKPPTAPPKRKEVKIHTPVMITKADLKKRHQASVKNYLSTDIWHQNRYPHLKEGVARNVVVNLDV